VILTGEVIEEGSFANVGSFSNVFDGDVSEAALSNELERAAEEPNAGFDGAALAAADDGGR
jgi:hypothetical protein